MGEVEEYFANMLVPGDSFIFAGHLLRFLRLRDTVVEVQDGGSGEPKVPAYAGGRMPMTTNLADRVLTMLQDRASWTGFPAPVQEWLALNGDPRTGAIDMIDWIELIPFSETRNYVERVIENTMIYRAHLGEVQPHPLAEWLR